MASTSTRRSKVRVRNVDIDNNDDCITIKSGKDEDGLRVNRPSEDIIVENSHFHNGGSLVAMGSETSGGIRNVIVRHCVADSDNCGAHPVQDPAQPRRRGGEHHLQRYRAQRYSPGV